MKCDHFRWQEQPKCVQFSNIFSNFQIIGQTSSIGTKLLQLIESNSRVLSRISCPKWVPCARACVSGCVCVRVFVFVGVRVIVRSNSRTDYMNCELFLAIKPWNDIQCHNKIDEATNQLAYQVYPLRIHLAYILELISRLKRWEGERRRKEKSYHISQCFGPNRSMSELIYHRLSTHF